MGTCVPSFREPSSSSRGKENPYASDLTRTRNLFGRKPRSKHFSRVSASVKSSSSVSFFSRLGIGAARAAEPYLDSGSRPYSSSSLLRRVSRSYARRFNRFTVSSSHLIFTKRRRSNVKRSASAFLCLAAISTHRKRQCFHATTTHASCATGRPRAANRQCLNATTAHSRSTSELVRGARFFERSTKWRQCFQHKDATCHPRAPGLPPAGEPRDSGNPASRMARSSSAALPSAAVALDASTRSHHRANREESASSASPPRSRGGRYRGGEG